MAKMNKKVKRKKNNVKDVVKAWQRVMKEHGHKYTRAELELLLAGFQLTLEDFAIKEEDVSVPNVYQMTYRVVPAGEYRVLATGETIYKEESLKPVFKSRGIFVHTTDQMKMKLVERAKRENEKAAKRSGRGLNG